VKLGYPGEKFIKEFLFSADNKNRRAEKNHGRDK